MRDWLSWLLFIILSVIWGSSFILMKEGLEALSSYQVASLRMFSAGISLLPFVYKSLKNIPKDKRLYVFLSGFLGSFIPAFCFCIAEERIDSSLAGILNALTPLFTIILGVSFFQMKATQNKWLGIIIGFIGLVLLPFAGTKGVNFTDMAYAGLVVFATFIYGLNVNIVGKHLKEQNSLHITATAMFFLLIPSGLIFFLSGDIDTTKEHFWSAIAAGCTLGVIGTAVATVLFYILLKRAGSLFASTVTYGIPFVAVVWGIIFKEDITLLQISCLGIILLGVYLTNKKKATEKIQ